MGKRRRLAHCKCDCGNEVDVQVQYLNYGDTTSCGCIKSKGELYIRQYCHQHNIEFKTEYSFDDLILEAKLRFDFALFKNNKLIGLIEYNGEQHYIVTNKWYKEKIALTDKMKVSYCKEHNIPLYIIKYTDNVNISMENIINELYG